MCQLDEHMSFEQPPPIGCYGLGRNESSPLCLCRRRTVERIAAWQFGLRFHGRYGLVIRRQVADFFRMRFPLGAEDEEKTRIPLKRLGLSSISFLHNLCITWPLSNKCKRPSISCLTWHFHRTSPYVFSALIAFSSGTSGIGKKKT